MNDAVPSSAPRIRKHASSTLAIAMWVFAIAWNGAILGVGLLVIRQETFEWGPFFVLGVMALAGLVLIRFAVRATASAARFRGTELALNAPGVLGGTINGMLRVPQRVLRHEGLKLCVSASRDAGDLPPDLLWESVEPVKRTAGGGDELALVPFSILLPFDCEPTSSLTEGTRVRWTLELRSKNGSVNFEVPVERNARSSPEQTRDKLRPVVKTAPAGAVALVERHLDGVDVRFPMPSWVLSWYASITVLAIGAFAMAWLILQRREFAEMKVLVQVGVYAAIAGVAIVLAGFPLLSLALIVRTIHADRTGVTIAFALKMREPLHVPIKELKDVQGEYSSASARYTVDFIRKDGRPIATSVMFVTSSEEAQWIAGELRGVLFAVPEQL